MIIPEYFPESRLHFVTEKKVFDELKKIADHFDIYYHKKVTNYHNLPCEIDFVISDRNKSILLLEVKGGQVHFENGKWMAYGKEMDDDPVDQILKNQSQFLKKYSFEKKILVDHCICLPDSELSSVPDYLLDYQILNKYHFYNLADSLRDAFKKSRENLSIALPRTPIILDTREYEQIKKQIEGAVRYSFPLTKKVALEDQKIKELTEEQYLIYECCTENDRILINGVAGSGKTIVAQKIAKEYYQQGADVLLLCYNVMLGKAFEAAERKITSTKSGKNRLIASACHDFLRALVPDQSFYGSVETITDKAQRAEFYELDVPIHVGEAINSGSIPAGQFDVLILDEAQDFSETILEQLFRLVCRGGKIILLKDDKQIIHKQNFIPEIETFFRLRLSKNLRNTKAILRFISQHLNIELSIHPDIPEGDPVQQTTVKDNRSMLQQMSLQINYLIKKEGVLPENILILYPEKIEAQHCLYGAESSQGFNYAELPDTLQRAQNTIYYTRIRKFKGMEAGFVFIPNFELFVNGSLDENYVYTCLTRAKNRLYIYQKAI